MAVACRTARVSAKLLFFPELSLEFIPPIFLRRLDAVRQGCTGHAFLPIEPLEQELEKKNPPNGSALHFEKASAKISSFAIGNYHHREP